MKKTWKRLCTGFLALATVVTALPTTPVHAESKQYWTESAERVGIIEKVMNDGSIGSTFNEGSMKVEGETAYCIDINTDFKNGYKTRADASSRMSADQISDVALSLEYVKQYGEAHKELNYKQVYLLEQCVVWQRCGNDIRVYDDELAEALKKLPERKRDNVLMYYFLELSDTKIADILNITRSGAFRSRYHALEALKKSLKEEK